MLDRDLLIGRLMALYESNKTVTPSAVRAERRRLGDLRLDLLGMEFACTFKEDPHSLKSVA